MRWTAVQDQAGNTHVPRPLCLLSLHCMTPPHPTPLHPLSLPRSRCGNFGFVGSESGRVDRYNMQSGMHRGSYCRDPKASRSWAGWRRLWAAAMPGAVWLCLQRAARAGLAVDRAEQQKRRTPDLPWPAWPRSHPGTAYPV